MPLLRAFSTLGCPELGADQVFALARSHGLSAIELRALGGSLDLPAALVRAFGTPKGLASAVSAARLGVVSLDTSFRLVGGSPDDREALLAHGDWAEAAGVPSLRVFDGGREAGEPFFEEAKQTLAWWSEVRRSRGWSVDLAIETHDLLVTSERILEAVHHMPGARIVWDSHHTWRLGGEDPIATWNRIAPWVAQIHVKDSRLVAGAALPYSYVLPGAGDFPARALLDRLERDNFSGAVSLEWERLWHPSLPPLDEALAAASRSWWG